MAKGIEAGNSFLAGVLAKLPAEERQQGEAALATLTALGGGVVVAAVGDGTLAQEELSRKLDEQRAALDEITARQKELDDRDAGLTAWQGELTGWYTANKERLAKATPGGNGNPKKVETPPAGGLTQEQLEEQMVRERAAFLGFQRDQNEITRSHFEKFHEVPALEPLLRHPQIATLGLTGVYELVHKERLMKHEADARTKAEEAIRLDERQKVLASQASMPYPTPTGPGSGSPLDALTQKSTPVVDAAVEHYNRLQQERLAGTRA